jgi:hypothetical protein
MTSLSAARSYFQHVSAANTEEAKKLQFVNYLNQVFGQNEEARTIISEFAGGAERKVLNIKKIGGGVKTRLVSLIRSTARSSSSLSRI